MTTIRAALALAIKVCGVTAAELLENLRNVLKPGMTVTVQTIRVMPSGRREVRIYSHQQNLVEGFVEVWKADTCIREWTHACGLLLHVFDMNPNFSYKGASVGSPHGLPLICTAVGEAADSLVVMSLGRILYNDKYAFKLGRL